MWTHFRPDAATVLEDEKARASLARYFDVTKNEKTAKFVIAKKLKAGFSEDDSMEELWQQHSLLTQKFYKFQREIDAKQMNVNKMPSPERSYLDLKVEIANRILLGCHFCSRRCKINRKEGKLGYCGCGPNITVSSIFEHMGEEPELVPSGTIFTMGCTMQCKHCQNYTISQWIENGQIYKPEGLATEIEKLAKSGCRNVNLVGGEPTPWLQQWLLTFKNTAVNIPVVWNSNSYYSSETSKLLAGFVDVYLLDFKYGPGECATRISNAPDYWKHCTDNHLTAMRFGELIVRILVLPDHQECCAKPITDWIARNLGRDTRVNMMFQYRPEWRAYEIPELRRRLSKSEIEEAMLLAKTANLCNLVP